MSPVSRTFLRFSLLGVFLLSPLAQAKPMDAQIARLKKESPDDPERMEMTRVQIFLDRASFRPGKIDGLGGEFTQKAADRYNRAFGLPEGSRLDTSALAAPYREYTVTEEDLKWVGPQASTPAAQAKLKAMLYANVWELVAEKFHCDLQFLHDLNPSIGEDKAIVGTVFRVPDVNEFAMSDVTALEKQRRDDKKAAAEKAKTGETSEASPTPTPAATQKRSIILLRQERLIEVYEGDKLVACFPCTPGSKEVPVVEGMWKITGNVLMPNFRWDKSVLESGVRSENAFNLPPGPNNPVGIVWISINRPSIGMHGTPTPDQIGRNESHGCIRLANWDAFILSQLVEKGSAVEVK